MCIRDRHRLGIRKLDPLIGRKEEIEELIKALRKRNKANAVLIGEPGVGKTHIVEHLAKKIEDGEIPELEDKKISEWKQTQKKLYNASIVHVIISFEK